MVCGHVYPVSSPESRDELFKVDCPITIGVKCSKNVHRELGCISSGKNVAIHSLTKSFTLDKQIRKCRKTDSLNKQKKHQYLMLFKCNVNFLPAPLFDIKCLISLNSFTSSLPLGQSFLKPSYQSTISLSVKAVFSLSRDF